MDLNLIRNYVIRDKFYTSCIGMYFIPRKVKINNKLIDIVFNREKAILNDKSSYSINFKNFIDNNYNIKEYNYIEEFPIIIENVSLWNSILNSFSVSLDDSIRNTRYFLLDYFFPYLGIAVEIDSKYHKVKVIYDKARDIYVERVYGIITYRFYEFGNNDEHAIPYINLFNRITNSIINRFKSNNLSIREIPINYSKTIIGNFIKDNKKALEFVDNLIKFIGFTEFFLKRSITVNLKQLSRVTNEISGIPYNKLKQTSFEKLFLDNISNLVCGIYQKVLNFI